MSGSGTGWDGIWSDFSIVLHGSLFNDGGQTNAERMHDHWDGGIGLYLGMIHKRDCIFAPIV